MSLSLSIITGNSGKFIQIAEALPSFVTATQKSFDIPEIQTNKITTISAEKCKEAFRIVQGPVLVDDSGIYCHAFNEFPGALTKFLYEGVGLAGIQRLYAGVVNKRAHFECVLSYMDETMESPVQSIGTVEGTITFEYIDRAEENKGLPYDLIFQPDGMDKPAFFAMEDRKNNYNHRVRAVKKFAQWLEQQSRFNH